MTNPRCKREFLRKNGVEIELSPEIGMRLGLAGLRQIGSCSEVKAASRVMRRGKKAERHSVQR
jgi:hypothetical protein